MIELTIPTKLLQSANLWVVDGNVRMFYGSTKPSLILTGLPQHAAAELSSILQSAIKLCGRHLPKKTVMEFPEGCRMANVDLALLMGLLSFIGELPEGVCRDSRFFGHIQFNERNGAHIIAMPGILALAGAALTQQDVKKVYVPVRSAPVLAQLYPEQREKIVAVFNVQHAVAAVLGQEKSWPYGEPRFSDPNWQVSTFDDVRGLSERQLRMIEVAAAGQHPLLLVGYENADKDKLASRILSLLPGMSAEDRKELTLRFNAVGLHDGESKPCKDRPYRAPHYSIAERALNGPIGEWALADKGILTLLNITEFRASTLYQLAAKNKVRRAHRSLIVATMNRCLCAYMPCTCRDEDKELYRRQVENVMHMRIFELRMPFDEAPSSAPKISADRVALMRDRILWAWGRQRHRENPRMNKRYDTPEFFNEDLQGEAVERIAQTLADMEKQIGPITDRHREEARALMKWEDK